MVRGWATTLLVAIILASGLSAPTWVNAAAPCAADALSVLIRVESAGGSLSGNVYVTNRSATPCVVPGVPGLQVVDGRLNPLVVNQTSPPTSAVVLNPGKQATIAITWANYRPRSPGLRCSLTTF